METKFFHKTLHVGQNIPVLDKQSELKTFQENFSGFWKKNETFVQKPFKTLSLKLAFSFIEKPETL